MSTPQALTPTAVISRLSRTEYDAIEALNFSRFKVFCEKTPAHFKAYTSLDSHALEFGEAFHCALLEPEKFARTYVVSPKFDRRTKDGKAAAAEFEAKNAGKKVLTPEDNALLAQMVRAVREHPIAGALLRRAERTEVACLWTDRFGIARKALLDAVAFLNTDQTTIYDLKTTQDASPADFGRSIGKFKYHWQAAYYHEALTAVGYAPKHFCFVAVEKTAPYGVAVYRLGEDSIRAAKAQMAPYFRKFAECLKADSWPSYGNTVLDIDAPAWALNYDSSEYVDEETL